MGNKNNNKFLDREEFFALFNHYAEGGNGGKDGMKDFHYYWDNRMNKEGISMDELHQGWMEYDPEATYADIHNTFLAFDHD